MKTKNGYTLVELLIAVSIGGILLAILVGIVNGNSIFSSKQQCINNGGKWTEGIQYGRMTQLCTYN
jgi:prepilin-type N-terminal cleavage/methylation domain-containing protein